MRPSLSVVVRVSVPRVDDASPRATLRGTRVILGEEALVEATSTSLISVEHNGDEGNCADAVAWDACTRLWEGSVVNIIPIGGSKLGQSRFLWGVSLSPSRFGGVVGRIVDMAFLDKQDSQVTTALVGLQYLHHEGSHLEDVIAGDISSQLRCCSTELGGACTVGNAFVTCRSAAEVRHAICLALTSCANWRVQPPLDHRDRTFEGVPWVGSEDVVFSHTTTSAVILTIFFRHQQRSGKETVSLLRIFDHKGIGTEDFERQIYNDIDKAVIGQRSTGNAYADFMMASLASEEAHGIIVASLGEDTNFNTANGYTSKFVSVLRNRYHPRVSLRPSRLVTLFHSLHNEEAPCIIVNYATYVSEEQKRRRETTDFSRVTARETPSDASRDDRHSSPRREYSTERKAFDVSPPRESFVHRSVSELKEATQSQREFEGSLEYRTRASWQAALREPESLRRRPSRMLTTPDMSTLSLRTEERARVRHHNEAQNSRSVSASYAAPHVDESSIVLQLESDVAHLRALQSNHVADLQRVVDDLSSSYGAQVDELRSCFLKQQQVTTDTLRGLLGDTPKDGCPRREGVPPRRNVLEAAIGNLHRSNSELAQSFAAFSKKQMRETVGKQVLHACQRRFAEVQSQADMLQRLLRQERLRNQKLESEVCDLRQNEGKLLGEVQELRRSLEGLASKVQIDDAIADAGSRVALLFSKYSTSERAGSPEFDVVEVEKHADRGLPKHSEAISTSKLFTKLTELRRVCIGIVDEEELLLRSDDAIALRWRRSVSQLCASLEHDLHELDIEFKDFRNREQQYLSTIAYR